MMIGVAFLAGASLLAADDTLTWYVSPEGNDSWSGRLATVNEQHTDGPLGTLRAALEAAREQSGKSRRIVLSAGRHFLEETLTLDARDGDLLVEGAGPGKTVVLFRRRVAASDGGPTASSSGPLRFPSRDRGSGGSACWWLAMRCGPGPGCRRRGTLSMKRRFPYAG